MDEVVCAWEAMARAWLWAVEEEAAISTASRDVLEEEASRDVFEDEASMDVLEDEEDMAADFVLDSCWDADTIWDDEEAISVAEAFWDE